MSGRKNPYIVNIEKSKKRLQSLQEYKELVEISTNNEYSLLDTNLNSLDAQYKITIRHNICNLIYRVVPNKFKIGRRCPNCMILVRSKVRRKSLEDYRIIIETNTNNEYSLLSTEVTTTKNKILIKHNVCDLEYYVSNGNFNNGNRCPRCSKLNRESKSISLIKDILNYLNIDFIQEYIFDGCFNIKPLPFDFYVPLIEGKFILIEYDGEQHFIPWNKDLQGLERQQVRDAIKNQYCLDNNIPLLRIRYDDKDLENTLITFLENYEDLLKFKLE